MIDKNKTLIRRLFKGECACVFTKEQYLYWGALVGLIILATVISSDFSRDSHTYNYYFRLYGSPEWSDISAEIFRRELFFLVVSKFFYKLGLGAIFLFLIHAAISLSVKFYLIFEHSKDPWLSLAYFCSYFFILHDCTQIRYGMAVAFVYLGLHYLADNRKLVFSVIVVLSAVLFHNAILIFIVLLFFTSRKSLYWLLGMIAIAVILYPLNLNAVMLDLTDDLVKFLGVKVLGLDRLHSFLLRPSSDLHLGIFSRHGLLIYVFGIVIFKYRNEFNKYEYLCFNSFLLSIFFWILMKDSMDFQVRFNDAFGFSLVFLIPYVHKRLSEYVSERNAYILLLLFFVAYIAKFVLYDKMVVL